MSTSYKIMKKTMHFRTVLVVKYQSFFIMARARGRAAPAPPARFFFLTHSPAPQSSAKIF